MSSYLLQMVSYLFVSLAPSVGSHASEELHKYLWEQSELLSAGDKVMNKTEEYLPLWSMHSAGKTQ